MGVPVQSLVASGLPTQARIALEGFMRQASAQMTSLAVSPTVQRFRVGDGAVSAVVSGFETLASVVYGPGDSGANVASPQLAPGAMFQDGYRVRYGIQNGSAGAVSTSFGSAYRLAGAWVDPGAGKQRSIEFQYDFQTKLFNEQWRTAADV